MSITRKQENEFRSIYKTVILKKLGLSMKFPRYILYARKSALEIGILKPSTIIDTLSLKLYLGHKRRYSRISKLIKTNEEYIMINYGINNNPIRVYREDRYWKNS